MKTFLFFLLISTFSFGQEIEYNKPIKNGSYMIYLSKDNVTVKVGDSVHINAPESNIYKYITFQGIAATTAITNKTFQITRIKAYYTKKLGALVVVGIIGKGLKTVWIDYENAITANEVSIMN